MLSPQSYTGDFYFTLWDDHFRPPARGQDLCALTCCRWESQGIDDFIRCGTSTSSSQTRASDWVETIYWLVSLVWFSVRDTGKLSLVLFWFHLLFVKFMSDLQVLATASSSNSGAVSAGEVKRRRGWRLHLVWELKTQDKPGLSESFVLGFG